MRQAVKDVAKLFPSAIISGRGREKVENFVKLSELYYAGSHGMDIEGPKVGQISMVPSHPVVIVLHGAYNIPSRGTPLE